MDGFEATCARETEMRFGVTDRRDRRANLGRDVEPVAARVEPGTARNHRRGKLCARRHRTRARVSVELMFTRRARARVGWTVDGLRVWRRRNRR
jgi:hypothetical protein